MTVPFRVCLHLLAVRSVDRTDFPELSLPVTKSPGLAPCEMSCPPSPRFRSQAFSTSQRFPGRPKLRGPVSCHIRVGSSPPEFSPRSSRVHLSEPLAPLWLSTRVQRRATPSLVTVRFRGPHPLRHGCRPPRTTMGSLLACRGVPPGHPGPWAAESPPTADVTHFEALFLLRIRSHRPRFLQNRRSILSWVSAPLELSPPTPRTLDPPDLNR
jgi:hypothetical protein